MDFCQALCNLDNPHGCCNSDSDLFYIWLCPVAVVTSPIWLPIAFCGTCCVTAMHYINTNIEWSRNHSNKYEVVDDKS
jgi:hypothetical protein